MRLRSLVVLAAVAVLSTASSALPYGAGAPPTPGLLVAVDTDPPETTIDSGPSVWTNDPTPTFTFSASEPSTFQCRIDAASLASCSSPWTSPLLADGFHSFEVTATDAAGNTDPTPARRPFTVDTTVPATPHIDSGPSGLTSDPRPTFTFSGGSFFQCRIDSASFTSCRSAWRASWLADGAHTFEVRGVTLAGNAGAAASRSFTLDTTAPETTILSGPTGTITATTATFTFSASEPATFACRLDAEAFVPCSSPYTRPGLTVEGHTLFVRATDTVGNVDPTPAKWLFWVGPARTHVAVVSRTVAVTSKHVAKIKVRCGVAACRGTLTLTATVRSKGHTRKPRIGSATFLISAGLTATVNVKLTAKGYELLARKRKLAVQVKITHKQPAGGSATVVSPITLRAPRR